MSNLHTMYQQNIIGTKCADYMNSTGGIITFIDKLTGRDLILITLEIIFQHDPQGEIKIFRHSAGKSLAKQQIGNVVSMLLQYFCVVVCNEQFSLQGKLAYFKIWEFGEGA